MSYPGVKAVLAVDILPISLDWKLIGLIKRNQHPEMDRLVLAGGHFDADNRNCTLLPKSHRCPPDPSLPHAVIRETDEEINIQLAVEDVEEWEWLDEIGRDPREFEEGEDRRVSKCFISFVTTQQIANSKAQSDAGELHWLELDSITEDMVGFDHFRAIKKAQAEKQRRREFWTHMPDQNMFLPHVCDEMKNAIGEMSTNPGGCGIFWENSKNMATMETRLADLPIKACPFCGQMIHPPIED